MKTDKKTIVWLTTQFPNGDKNRNGMFIYRTVKFLSKYYDVHVLNLYSRTPPYLVMLKNLSEAGKIYKEWQERFPSKPVKPAGTDSFRVKYVKYFRLPRGRLDYLEKHFVYAKVKKYVRKLATKGKDVIIHSNWLFPESSVALELSKDLDLKYVVSLRGGDIRELMKGSGNYIKAKEILEHAEKIGMVTDDILKDAGKIKLSLKKEKIHILNNYYDVSKFNIKDRDETKKRIGINNDSKAVFYAGTLRELKNIGSLIKAFKDVKKKFNNIMLFIAGSGIEGKKLKKTADELDLKDDVVFLGNIDTDTMIDYYNASDVFCLPSFNEGLPNVCVESLLCGTPVVASAVGGVPSIINSEFNGYMFDPHSIKDISEKLVLVLEKEWNREKLRATVSKFMPENILKSYEEFYAF